MGHAGAVISTFGKSANGQVEILKEVGATIAPSPSEIGSNIAYLVHTARGEVIDQETLIHALSSHAIAGAGLDVYDNEPAFDKRLIDLENLCCYYI